jgi:ParB-like chromosome segregation protein Spo0J
MADLKDLATKRSALLWFPPNALEVKPGLNARDFNDPDNIEHVKATAASIAANGFYPSEPIAIFREVDGDEEHIYIADGECRWRAAKMAIESGASAEMLVACIPLPRGMNDVDLILHRNLANTGKRFTPLEEGHNIKHAIALGATIAEVAVKLGRSVSYVSQLLDFQAAPAEVHNAVRAGDISATLAAQVVREEGNAAAPEIVREAVKAAKASGKKKATARHVKPLTRKAKARTEAKPAWDIAIAPMLTGGYRVMFGDKSIVMPRRQWIEVARQILAECGAVEEAAA